MDSANVLIEWLAFELICSPFSAMNNPRCDPWMNDKGIYGSLEYFRTEMKWMKPGSFKNAKLSTEIEWIIHAHFKLHAWTHVAISLFCTYFFLNFIFFITNCLSNSFFEPPKRTWSPLIPWRTLELLLLCFVLLLTSLIFKCMTYYSLSQSMYLTALSSRLSSLRGC